MEANARDMGQTTQEAQPPDQQFRDELHKRLHVAEERLEQLGLQVDRADAQRREWYRVRDACRVALGQFDAEEKTAQAPDAGLRYGS